MCGIFGILASELGPEELRQLALRCSKIIRHRGPDWSGVYVDAEHGHAIAHERLSIVDPLHGAQPLKSPDNQLILGVNGEIYNHQQLREETPDYAYTTNSDCEVVTPLYIKYVKNAEDKLEGMKTLCNRLDGIFAFLLLDRESNSFYMARDPIGVNSLYFGVTREGAVCVASEMKALLDICVGVQIFPPGHFYSSETREFHPYYDPTWWSHDTSVPQEISLKPRCDLTELRHRLEQSVVKRLMCDVPYGVLLSGGLDSSLVASIAARHVEKRIEDSEMSAAWWPRLHTFSVGLEGSPDFTAARKVANFLNTVHHEFVYSLQEGLDAIRDVIYHIETYDVTTIRASTPMYLMARRIKAMGVKMVLSGEGADEIFGGYLYFHKAPNASEFHQETVRKIKALHQYDCARANKSTMAWGLEVRVPFLDLEFMDYAMSMNPCDKMCQDPETHTPRAEKWVIRKAFDTPERPYLPEDVLWRQKEQFSDGVGYGWIDSLRDLAETTVTDMQFRQRKYRFPTNTPATKEAYMYREIFDSLFPQSFAKDTVPGGPSVACSTAAAIEWDASLKHCVDPSGRAVMGVHNAAY